MTNNVLLPLLLLPLLFACAVPLRSSESRGNDGLATRSSGQLPLPSDAIIRYHQANGTIRYLKAANLSIGIKDNSIKKKTPVQAALSFIDHHKFRFKLENPSNELYPTQSQTDHLGLHHIRFQQQFKGLDIWACELNIHLTRQNEVYLVQGTYIPTPDISTKARINGKKALEKAISAGGYPATTKPIKVPVMVIYTQSGLKNTLAYKISLPGAIFFIDSTDGTILDRIATYHEINPLILHHNPP